MQASVQAFILCNLASRAWASSRHRASTRSRAKRPHFVRLSSRVAARLVHPVSQLRVRAADSVGRRSQLTVQQQPDWHRDDIKTVSIDTNSSASSQLSFHTSFVTAIVTMHSSAFALAAVSVLLAVRQAAAVCASGQMGTVLAYHTPPFHGSDPTLF